MEIVLVDNNKQRLSKLEDLLKSVYCMSHITAFVDPLLSAKYICNHPIDAVLIEAMMRPSDGMVLTTVLRKQKPKLPIIIMSDEKEYYKSAIQARANKFLIRPLNQDSVKILDAFLCRE